MNEDRYDSADSSPATGNFLGTATDNRISIVDPDRWEGLDSGEEDQMDEPRKAGQPLPPQPQPPPLPPPPPLQQPQQSAYRDSGDYENEGYRMFLTHRQQSNQPQPPPPPPAPADMSVGVKPSKEDEESDEDQEERFMENLGSRLVRQDLIKKSGRREEDDDDVTPRAAHQEFLQQPPSPLPPPQAPQQAPVQQQQQHHFSVRRGANQLSDLLPTEQRDKPLPQPPELPLPPQQPQPQSQPRQRQHPLAASIVASSSSAASATAAADDLPMVPKEVYAGYLRLESGHVFGPFRWTVESVETPATMEEGLATASSKPPGSLYSILIDSQRTAEHSSSSTRQRITTRTGRIDFLDQTGKAASSERLSQQQTRSTDESAAAVRSLQSLAAAVASLADGRSGFRVPEAEARLTRLMADALAGNGASLVLACTSASHQPSSVRQQQQQRKATPVEASVLASNPQPDSGAEAALLEKKQQLEQLHQLVGSMRKELDILKTENSSLKGRLKEAETAVVAASAAGGSASADPNLRPVSKSSYQSLYEMLQEYMQENEHLRNENLDLVKYQGEYRREQDQLAKENRQLANKLDRLQRQQQQQPTAQSQKPLYVVSNPQSRASPSNLKQQLQPQQQQQQQQHVENPAAAVETPLNLPPIQQAFQTPSASSPSQGSSLRSQQQQQAQLQLQQQQMRLRQQQQQQQLEAQNAYYQSHMPVAPVYQQQQMLPPSFQVPQQLQPTRPHQQQQSVHPQYAQESPLYVPKPGEKTYRGRYQQQAAVIPSHSRQHELKAHAAQDVTKLNESLKNELRQLDGAIQQHQRVNALQSDIRRNEGRKVLRTF